MKEEKMPIYFEKVSLKTFTDGCKREDAEAVYQNIRLPKRATSASAGYDFYSPFRFTLAKGQTMKIPTGIRVKMDPNCVLMLFPRSSLGFRYRMQLNNTVGIIDSDYYEADNEGHIFAKITNDSCEEEVMTIEEGQAFMQGIFVHYLLTDDDSTTARRHGGIGSTNQSNQKEK